MHHNTNGLSNINLFEDALNPLYAKPPVDILFMDAPYGQGLWERALAIFNERGWIGPQTYIVIEIDKGEKSPAPDGFEELDRRSYGRNTFIFMKKKSLLSNK